MIAVMGPEGAVDIVYKRELDGAKNREAARQEKIEEFATLWPIPTWRLIADLWMR